MLFMRIYRVYFARVDFDANKLKHVACRRWCTKRGTTTWSIFEKCAQYLNTIGKLALIKRRSALSVIPRVNRGRPTRYTKLDVYFPNKHAFSLRISHTVEQVCPPIRVSISIGP